MEIWTRIVQSNTFNFVVLMALFAFIISKCKLAEKLDSAILKIKETIENSENTKKDSLEELEKASQQTKNVLSEIQEIEDKGKINIANLEEKIVKDSEEQINSIKKSADKIIDAKEKEIASRLSKKTVLASLELAKEHIINLLKQNPSYHQKFIKESIEELNRLK